MPSGFGEFKFCSPEQCGRPANASACRQSGFDRAWAQFHITSLQRDSALMLAIRAFAQQQGLGPGSHLRDQTIINWLAGELASGRIRICTAPANVGAPATGDTGSTSTPSPPPDTQTQKAFPLAARQSTTSRSSGSTPATEQTVFPADVDVAALAQTLKDAAQAGAPFCEECQRAAQGG